MSVEVGISITFSNFLMGKLRGIDIDGIVNQQEGFRETCANRIKSIFEQVDSNQPATHEKQTTIESADSQRKKEIAGLKRDLKKEVKSLQEGLRLCQKIRVERYYEEESRTLSKDVSEITDGWHPHSRLRKTKGAGRPEPQVVNGSGRNTEASFS